VEPIAARLTAIQHEGQPSHGAERDVTRTSAAVMRSRYSAGGIISYDFP